uniref:Uncharacterized protein n=1 Tax=Fagus sylvatica TaxID=28930 RepID=A0A2N9FQ04_FAGSY
MAPKKKKIQNMLKKFIALENRIQSDEAVIASIQEVIDETKAELAEPRRSEFDSRGQ